MNKFKIILIGAVIVTIGIIFLPPTHAAVFTCYFEDWEGNQQKCSDRDINTGVYPYKLTQDKDYYYIERKGETLSPIPKNEGTHTFTPGYVGWTFEVVKDTPTNVRDSITTKLLPAVNSKEFQYQLPTYRDSNGTIIDILNNTLLESKLIEWPLFIDDPWIINSTEGWNGTYDNTNTNLSEALMIDIDNTAAPNDEAVSYWTMDNKNSTVIFDGNTSSGFDCTIVGPDDDVGWRNRSSNFILSNSDHLSCGDRDILTDGLTISVWANVSSATSWGGFAFKSYADSSKTGYTFWPLGTTLFFDVGNGSASGRIFASIAATANDWAHYTAVYNSTHLMIYVNGALLIGPTAHTGAIADNANPLYIGRGGTASTLYFQGQMDEIQIFQRGLTQSEVITIYNNSYYSSGNFTTDNKDAGAGNIANNVSATFTLDGGSSVNMYLNSSQDEWATETISLLCTGCTSATNYTAAISGGNYSIIVELINGSTPHISEIEVEESPDTTPPNITSMIPANNTIFSQYGNTLLVNFSATCTDNVACQNGTLEVWNSTGDKLNLTEAHTVTEVISIYGTLTGNSINEDNGVYTVIQEVSGGTDNCFETIFNVSGIENRSHNIVVDGRYSGNSPRKTMWWWYNFTGKFWVNWANQSKSATDERLTSASLNYDDSVNSGENLTIKMNRTAGDLCILGNRYYLDALFVQSTNNETNFTDRGDGIYQANITFELTSTGSPYLFSGFIFDTSGNIYQAPANYTFSIIAVAPNASNIFLIQPYNESHTAINILPIRGYINNEVELDKIWYSINGTTNTTFEFNHTTAILPNSESFNITVCINRTNGLENCTTRYFSIDYDGLYWESGTTDNPADQLQSIEDVETSMAAIAIAILSLGFFAISTRFEDTEVIMVRLGCIAVGILLALQTAFLSYETTAVSYPAVKLLINVVWLMVIALFFGLLFRIFKFMSLMPKESMEKNY